MPWYRMWINILDDPDLHELPNSTCWGWALMLAAAKKHESDGLLPPLKVLAHWLREKPSTVQGWISELSEAGLVIREGESLRMHGWDRWQEPRDRTNAERQARHRAGKKSPFCTPPDTESDTDQTRGNRYSYGVTDGGNGVTSPLLNSSDPVIRFGVEAIGDKFELESLPDKLKGWRALGCSDDWIKDAILVANCSAKPGGMASYMNTVLRNWKKRGSQDPDDLAKIKQHERPVTYTVAPKDWKGPAA